MRSPHVDAIPLFAPIRWHRNARNLPHRVIGRAANGSHLMPRRQPCSHFPEYLPIPVGSGGKVVLQTGSHTFELYGQLRDHLFVEYDYITKLTSKNAIPVGVWRRPHPRRITLVQNYTRIPHRVAELALSADRHGKRTCFKVLHYGMRATGV